MDLFQKVYKHLKEYNLPVKYSVSNKMIKIDCKSWDIREIDELILEIGGTRNGFIITIKEDSNK